MNVSAKGKNIDWRRIAGIAIVVLIFAYQYSLPTLERWFDRDLPSLTGESDQPSNPNERSTGSRDSGDSRYDAKLPAAKSSSSAPSTQGTESRGSDGSAQAANKRQSGDFLRSVGRDRLMSPEGLLYTMGPRGEHRVDHVLRHGRDMPNRPVHSVFEGGRNDILALIDEAYVLVKADSPQVRSSDSRDNEAYTIKMNRKVGYEGGQKGKRNGYPDLKSVKLILDGNRVITAYPVR